MAAICGRDVIGSCEQIKDLLGRGDIQGPPAVDFAQRDLRAGQQRPEQHASGIRAGQHAWGFDAAPTLLCHRRSPTRARPSHGPADRPAEPAKRPRFRRPCCARRAVPSACANAQRHQHRKAGRLPVQANPDHRTVEDQADDVIPGKIALCQASQSDCTLRQARLTVSPPSGSRLLPTAPPNSAAKARRTRRVLVPAR